MPKLVTVCWIEQDGDHPGELQLWVEPGHLTEEQVQESAFQFQNEGIDQSMDEDFMPKDRIKVSTRKPWDDQFLTVYYRHTEVISWSAS